MRLKSRRMSKRANLIGNITLWIIRLGIIAAIIWFIWAQEHFVISNQYVYADTNIPKALVGYNIVHISDIKNQNLNVYNTVKRLEPDIIVLTGGYSDSDGNSNNTVNIVNKLCSIAPVYYIYNPADNNGALSGTNAINITDNNIEIVPEIKDAETFIKDVYGDAIIKKAAKNDEQALQYIQYVSEALNSTNAKINLFGLGTYSEENGQYEARDKAYELILKSDAEYNISLIGNIGVLDEVCKADIDMALFGGTYGTNQISTKYIKGMYANNGTQLFVSSGIGTHNDMHRILNFPSVQSIILSDGTIENNNPLENLLGKIFKDVDAIYERDTSYVIYTYEY